MIFHPANSTPEGIAKSYRITVTRWQAARREATKLGGTAHISLRLNAPTPAYQEIVLVDYEDFQDALVRTGAFS